MRKRLSSEPRTLLRDRSSAVTVCAFSGEHKYDEFNGLVGMSSSVVFRVDRYEHSGVVL